MRRSICYPSSRKVAASQFDIIRYYCQMTIKHSGSFRFCCRSKHDIVVLVIQNQTYFLYEIIKPFCNFFKLESAKLMYYLISNTRFKG
jgi:hypothetical protein